MSSGSYGAASERSTSKRERTAYLIRATMKPIMKGERKGEMMKPIVHKFNFIHDVSKHHSIACKTHLSSLKVEREEVRHDEETLDNRVSLRLKRTVTAG